jgi:Xaa-Pro aminopeptidase
VITDGLVQIGVMKGSPDALVESGAHALFFPHGVGHLLGLDVHDMEAFGDRDRLRARPHAQLRSSALCYLRLDLDAASRACAARSSPASTSCRRSCTIAKFKKQFKGQVNFAKAEQFLTMNSLRGFGGIRIEDDVLCTDGGHDVLTAAVPKERVAVEALVGSAGA